MKVKTTRKQNILKRMSLGLLSAVLLTMNVQGEKTQDVSAAEVTNKVIVNAQDVITTIPEAIFGNNMATYVPQCDGSNTTVNNLMAALGQKVIRFPGGSYGDVYDWENYGTTDWRVSTDEGIKFTSSFGGTLQPIVNFSGYWGGVQHTHEEAVKKAADWVKYMNVTKKLNVKYWEVGNEIFGSWETGYTTGADYGTRFADFYKAMKAVDPNIEIGAVALASDSGGGYWNREVLQKAYAKGVVPDFLAVHAYPSSTSATNETILNNAKNNIDSYTATLDKVVKKYLGESYVGKIKYNMTEYNACLGDAAQHLTMTNALFTTQYVMEMAENKWGGANLWNIMNGSANTEAGDFGFISRTTLKPWPNYYAFNLMINKFGRTMVSNTTTTNEAISTYSAKDSSGNLTVILVNNSSTEDLVTNIGFNGFKPSGKGTRWILEGSGSDPINSKIVKINGAENPDPLTFKNNAGSSITTSSEFAVTLPKASITLLKIPGSDTTATPVTGPVELPKPYSEILYDFEDGETALSKWNVNSTTLSIAANPEDGGNALKITLPQNTGTSSVGYYPSTRQNLTKCVDGTTVSMRVYVAPECSSVSLQPYYKKANGSWVGSWKGAVVTGEFIEFSFKIPEGAGPISEFGLQINNGVNSKGYVLIDDVKVTPEPPSFRLDLNPNDVYTITNRKDFRSIGVLDSSTANGAKVVSSGGNNKWRFIEYYLGEYIIVNAVTGKVLDVPGASTADNTALIQWSRSNAKNQRWTFIESTKGYIKIKNVATGKIIDVSSLTAGANIIQKTDGNKTQQMWMLNKVEPEIVDDPAVPDLPQEPEPEETIFRPDVDPNSQYTIVNRKNYATMSTDPNGASNVLEGTFNDKWKIIEVKDGQYKIINAATGRALAVNNRSTNNGENLLQWWYDGQDYQLWRFIESTKGFVKIKNVNSGLVVDIADLSSTANIIQKTDQNKTQQMWKLTKVN